MIFHPDLIRLIERGKKIETRRPLKPYEPPTDAFYTDARGRRRPRPTPRVQQIAGRWYLAPPAPGSRVAVQPGRGKRAVAHVFVRAVEGPAVAGDLDQRAAIAEGFRTTADFRLYWVRLHDKAWIARQETRRDPDTGERVQIACLLDRALLQRFEDSHAHRQVWVIRFELDRTHRPRLLTPAARPETDVTPRRGRVQLVDPDDPGDHGYTDSTFAAMAGDADPGEYVDPTSLQPAWAALAELRHAVATEQPPATLEERLRAVRDAARRAGVDLGRQERELEGRIRAMERKLAARIQGRAA